MVVVNFMGAFSTYLALGLELVEVVLNFRVCVSISLSLSSLSIGLSLFIFISLKVVTKRMASLWALNSSRSF